MTKSKLSVCIVISCKKLKWKSNEAWVKEFPNELSDYNTLRPFKLMLIVDIKKGDKIKSSL